MNKTYNTICEQLVAAIQASGTLPWHQPWYGTTQAVSYATGKPYSILNQLLLGGIADEFLTWNQVQQHQARLRKGCHGHRVYFWHCFEKVELDQAGKKVTKQIPFLKTFTVFSVHDCEGIKPRWQQHKKSSTTISPIKQAEDLVNQYLTREKINLEHTRNEAFYSISRDIINIPQFDNFCSAEEYYSTLLHEATHSTGHMKRLARFKPNDKSSPFGSPNYGREELIAEMGASFLLHRLGIENKNTFSQNAAYLQNWIRALQNDVSLIPIAATRAEKAVQYILGEKQ